MNNSVVEDLERWELARHTYPAGAGRTKQTLFIWGLLFLFLLVVCAALSDGNPKNYLCLLFPLGMMAIIVIMGRSNTAKKSAIKWVGKIRREYEQLSTESDLFPEIQESDMNVEQLKRWELARVRASGNPRRVLLILASVSPILVLCPVLINALYPKRPMQSIFLEWFPLLPIMVFLAANLFTSRRRAGKFVERIHSEYDRLGLEQTSSE